MARELRWSRMAEREAAMPRSLEVEGRVGTRDRKRAWTKAPLVRGGRLRLQSDLG